ncbi:lysophospholipid acyltransferase family protein [Leptospira idonii]|uniref:1-acyl-sn-glycerol-3-phosphate acyltransferase n=1 Tax=Leptospira idonii TaxID=1193500 RepID=A0A4R9M914_9LEPT|nr:lysophospholipid acyltransferase family protein [Leptospira idonii]TGN20988.1 1-acyl-sn-glycerol-3-phosphate acyltransferase [Leptospira idonii]
MSIKSFIPAKFNLPALWFTDLSLPLILKIVHNLEGIEVSEEDKKILKSYQNERIIYISNHPTTKEPPVAYHVANLMSARFHYMAAREVFEWGAGFVGDFIQSLGAFSVLAGAPDRESLKASRDILASQGGKLVLFPEGEPTSGMNDTLLPFQSGVSQLGFWGLEDALKQDPSAKITVLLSYVKYRMTSSLDWMRKDIDNTLTRMEDKLGISKTGKDIVHRILSVGRRMIEREEREYGVQVEPDKIEDFDYRIGRMRHVMLDNIASKIRIPKWETDANAIEKLRKILTTLELVSIGAPDPNGELPSPDMATWARKAAAKAYDFITFQTGYIKELASAERLYEFLYRYETELFGESRSRPHKAVVTYARPISIGEFYEDYKKDKRKAVDDLTERFRMEMNRLLEDEKSKSLPLFPSNYIF